MFYISLNKVKKIFEIDSDEVAEKIIKNAEILLESSLGQSLKKQSHTARIDGNGSDFLYLDIAPTSVEKIEVEGEKITPHYIDGLIVRTQKTIAKGRKNVVIEYTTGSDECPDDVKNFFENFLYDLKNFEKNVEAVPSGVKSQKISDLSITYLSPEEMALGANSRTANPAMQAILQKYKKFSLHSTL